MHSVYFFFFAQSASSVALLMNTMMIAYWFLPLRCVLDKIVLSLLPNLLLAVSLLIFLRPNLASGIGLHASWLVTLFYRLSVHESTLIRRWLVLTILNLDYSKYRIFLQPDVPEVTPFIGSAKKICILRCLMMQLAAPTMLCYSHLRWLLGHLSLWGWVNV